MSGIGGEILVILSGGLDVSGRVVTDPVLVAGERIARILLQVKGSAGHAPDRGLGLRQLQNADLGTSDMARIAGDASREARRVDGVVTALFRPSRRDGALVLTGSITIDSGQTFTLTVTSAGAAEVL